MNSAGRKRGKCSVLVERRHGVWCEVGCEKGVRVRDNFGRAARGPYPGWPPLLLYRLSQSKEPATFEEGLAVYWDKLGGGGGVIRSARRRWAWSVSGQIL
jgi:hypothetical protein